MEVLNLGGVPNKGLMLKNRCFDEWIGVEDKLSNES
jgi:hypothetical protein